MARVAAIAELKARLSEYLKIVKSGTEVVVTERGNPIARIIPYQKTDPLSQHLLELARSGLVRIGSGILPESFWNTQPPADPEGRSLACLLAERADSR